MGVGALATRFLADFGAQVIKIEDRTRLDLPRRLPIYKDEPARAYGNEDPNPDPNKGGLFNNFSRNKLGVTINMRTDRGRELAERLIEARNVSGQGTDIDVSAVEAGIELLGPLLLDVAVNGRSTRTDSFPTGNRLEHPQAAPHGVYPCIGDDRWVAIAVFDDAEWRSLAE